MYIPILRLCLVGGTMLFFRWVLSDYPGLRNRHFSDEVKSTEW